MGMFMLQDVLYNSNCIPHTVVRAALTKLPHPPGLPFPSTMLWSREYRIEKGVQAVRSNDPSPPGDLCASERFQITPQHGALRSFPTSQNWKCEALNPKDIVHLALIQLH